MTTIINSISEQWLVFLFTLFLASLFVFGFRWLVLSRHTQLAAEQKLPRQLSLIVVTVIAIVSVILALPIAESIRNQLLALLGVLLSGVIAFSATNIVSNLIAGLILRVNKPFRTGDYIKCAQLAGRVTEKGLLDTEFQTEQRTLIHVTNSFLLQNPIEVVRSSGTIISAEISIGYDTHHSSILNHLKNAAQHAGLSDAFAHVVKLGDFSVEYKISGMLLDTKNMITTRSNLHTAILDELHNHDIEIMSPNFVAQRPTDPHVQFVAKAKTKQTKPDKTQEELAFDKADEAEKLELKKIEIQARINQLSEKLKHADDTSKASTKSALLKSQDELASLINKLGLKENT